MKKIIFYIVIGLFANNFSYAEGITKYDFTKIDRSIKQMNKVKKPKDLVRYVPSWYSKKDKSLLLKYVKSSADIPVWKRKGNTVIIKGLGYKHKIEILPGKAPKYKLNGYEFTWRIKNSLKDKLAFIKRILRKTKPKKSSLFKILLGDDAYAARDYGWQTLALTTTFDLWANDEAEDLVKVMSLMERQQGKSDKFNGERLGQNTKINQFKLECSNDYRNNQNFKLTLYGDGGSSSKTTYAFTSVSSATGADVKSTITDGIRYKSFGSKISEEYLPSVKVWQTTRNTIGKNECQRESSFSYPGSNIKPTDEWIVKKNCSSSRKPQSFAPLLAVAHKCCLRSWGGKNCLNEIKPSNQVLPEHVDRDSAVK